MSAALALRVRGIRKSFGPVEVLRGVDFDVRSGEVHVLAGENGAGKSTLIKIISGVYQDYSGDLELDGVVRRFRDPTQAAQAGVSTIHQELALVPTMSVATAWGGSTAADNAAKRTEYFKRQGSTRRPRTRSGDCPSPSSRPLSWRVRLQAICAS